MNKQCIRESEVLGMKKEKELQKLRQELNNQEITDKSKWNTVSEFEDCPSLNKEVLAVHDDQIYYAVFERDGEGYCWRLEDERGIQFVDIYDVELWLDIN